MTPETAGQRWSEALRGYAAMRDNGYGEYHLMTRGYTGMPATGLEKQRGIPPRPQAQWNTAKYPVLRSTPKP